MHLGFIGIGYMGSRLGSRLIEAGHDLSIHDLNRKAADELADKGAFWSDSPREVAQSAEIIFASLPGPQNVEQVVLEPERGLLAGLSKGKVFIDLTTSEPLMTRKLAAAVEKTGAAMLDSPITGRGGGVFVVGGDKATFERCEPIIASMGTKVIHAGPQGSGHIVKLCYQYANTVAHWAFMEALVVCAAAGTDVRVMREFFDAAGLGQERSPEWLERILSNDFGEPETAAAVLDIFAKDMSLAIELGREVGASTGTGLATYDIIKRGQTHEGWGRLNHAVAVQVLEDFAGVDLRGEPREPSQPHG